MVADGHGEEHSERFRRLVAVEAGVMLGIVAVTAVLVGASL